MRVPFAPLSIAVALAGAALGYAVGRTTTSAHKPDVGESPQRAKKKSLAQFPTFGPIHDVSTGALITIDHDPSEVLGFLKKIAGSDDAFAFADVCESLFRSWAAKNPDAAIEAVEGVENRVFRSAAIQGALHGLFANDPERAMKQLVDWQYDGPHAFSVPDWLKENPATGCALLSQMGNSGMGLQLRWTLPRVWAEDEPAAALEWARTQPGAAGAQIREIVIKAWAETDLVGAEAAFESGNVSDKKLRSALGVAIASARAKNDPKAALTWAAEHLDLRGFTSTTARVLGDWAEDNLADAVEWTLAQPNADTQRIAFSALAEQWAEADVSSAAKFAVESDSLLVSSWGFLRTVGENYAKQDPIAALDWTEQLRGDLRSRAQTPILRKLLATDPKLAGAEVSKRLQRISAASLESFSYHFFKSDPDAAAAWMKTIYNGPALVEIRNGLRDIARERPSEKMQSLLKELDSDQ